MARLLERMGRLTEAEKYFRMSHERYSSGVSALVEFLVRHQDDPGMAASLRRIVTDVFPGGQQPVRNDEFSASRPVGASVASLPDAPRDRVPGGELLDEVGAEQQPTVSARPLAVRSAERLRRDRNSRPCPVPFPEPGQLHGSRAVRQFSGHARSERSRPSETRKPSRASAIGGPSSADHGVRPWAVHAA